MKTTTITTTALLTFLFAGSVHADEAPVPCQNLMNEISRKIVRNGVPSSDFILKAVARDDVDPSRDRVVGTCNFGAHRVVYIRGKDINPGGLSGNYATSANQPDAANDSAVTETFTPEINESVAFTSDRYESDVTENANVSLNNQPDTAPVNELFDEDGDSPQIFQETEIEEPVTSQTEIIITTPENDPLYANKITNDDNSIIIYR